MTEHPHLRPNGRTGPLSVQDPAAQTQTGAPGTDRVTKDGATKEGAAKDGATLSGTAAGTPGSARAVPPAVAPAGRSLYDELRSLEPETLQNLAGSLHSVFARLAEAGFLTTDPNAPRGMLYDRPDPFGAKPAIARAAAALWQDPMRVHTAQTELWDSLAGVWNGYLGRLAGNPAKPSPDKRFKDPEWTQNPQYELLVRTYLTISEFFIRQAETAPGLSEAERRKAVFFTREKLDALSPTNFAGINPQIIREAIRTGGQSLLDGIDNYINDTKRGQGNLKISQTDFTKFDVGRNIATAPGKVVFRNRLIELLQYSPTTEKVFRTPLLIFPPWINKFYIMDLTPANSMIRWLTDQGFTVFLVSWANPDHNNKDLIFEDYAKEGVFPALEAVGQATGEKDCNVIGYCIGGTMLASTLAYMGQTGDKRIKSATFFAAQTDFSEAGDLLIFTDDMAFDYLQSLIDRNDGILDGQYMSATFNLLRGNDLIWRYWVDNYLLGKTPPAFDLLYWNADQTRMTRGTHLFYIDNYYRNNRLSRGELFFLGKRVSLSDIKIPCFFQAGREDHIAPYNSIYKGARKFGGPVRFMLAGSGHIAGVINHPAQGKYQHWINDSLPATADAWLLGAEERKGSWWPSWFEWLAPRSGAKVTARIPGERNLPALGDAPGGYVKVT